MGERSRDSLVPRFSRAPSQRHPALLVTGAPSSLLAGADRSVQASRVGLPPEQLDGPESWHHPGDLKVPCLPTARPPQKVQLIAP